MFTHIKAGGLNDFFTELQNRPQRGVYFYRISNFNENIRSFILKYYDAASKNGIVIEGGIPNPDNKMLAYYNDVMGTNFNLDINFITQSLKKWLPRMNVYQNREVSSAIYDALLCLRNSGKTESVLKNAYIKFMCWLYYKFERIVSRLGGNNIPKILYEGSISRYELMMLVILARSGCDIILLQYSGDDEYLKLDPDSKYSVMLAVSPALGFPTDFCLKKIREENRNIINKKRLLGEKPSVRACTNAWLKGKGFEELMTPVKSRGADSGFFYNFFVKINGVENKMTYLNELYRYRKEMENQGKKFVIIQGNIPLPKNEEISKIRRNNSKTIDGLIANMAENISYPNHVELQRLIINAFADIITEYSHNDGMNINRLTGRAVYALCWLKRYGDILFRGMKLPETSCFVCLGGCQNENEAIFVRLLSRLPVDVLLLVPDKNDKYVFRDKSLYEINYEETLSVSKYPEDASELRLGTVAYHAEKELDRMLYSDSGMYRNRQYGRADAIVIKTMYEEINILWKQELKYRPNFEAVDVRVIMPVIFSKICGVKDGNVNDYWSNIKGLFTADTVLYDHFPIIQAGAYNPLKSAATDFFRNGRLQRDAIKKHKLYKYGVLREEAQEHILDKIQLMINKRIIKGTLESGVEYAIIATVLNLDKAIVRLIQKFDFTKTNPKIICLSLNEEVMTLEDTIFITFLSLVGFDIAVFVPTGYQTIERFFNSGVDIFDEHEEGEYMYDLKAPDFRVVRDTNGESEPWYKKIFRKGR